MARWRCFLALAVAFSFFAFTQAATFYLRPDRPPTPPALPCQCPTAATPCYVGDFFSNLCANTSGDILNFIPVNATSTGTFIVRTFYHTPRFNIATNLTFIGAQGVAFDFTGSGGINILRSSVTIQNIIFVGTALNQPISSGCSLVGAAVLKICNSRVTLNRVSFPKNTISYQTGPYIELSNSQLVARNFLPFTISHNDSTEDGSFIRARAKSLVRIESGTISFAGAPNARQTPRQAVFFLSGYSQLHLAAGVHFAGKQDLVAIGLISSNFSTYNARVSGISLAATGDSVLSLTKDSTTTWTEVYAIGNVKFYIFKGSVFKTEIIYLMGPSADVRLNGQFLVTSQATFIGATFQTIGSFYNFNLTGPTASLQLLNSTFNGAAGPSGGALVSLASSSPSTTFLVSGCTFTNNTGTLITSFGPASVQIASTTFAANQNFSLVLLDASVRQSHFIDNTSPSTALILDRRHAFVQTSFTNNTVAAGGALLHVGAGSLVECAFRHNRAADVILTGPQATTLTMTTVTIESNIGTPLHITDQANVTIHNLRCLLNLSPTRHGGCVLSESAGTLELRNSTLASNSAPLGCGGAIALVGVSPASLGIFDSALTFNKAQLGGALCLHDLPTCVFAMRPTFTVERTDLRNNSALSGEVIYYSSTPGRQLTPLPSCFIPFSSTNNFRVIGAFSSSPYRLLATRAYLLPPNGRANVTATFVDFWNQPVPGVACQAFNVCATAGNGLAFDRPGPVVCNPQTGTVQFTTVDRTKAGRYTAVFGSGACPPAFRSPALPEPSTNRTFLIDTVIRQDAASFFISPNGTGASCTSGAPCSFLTVITYQIEEGDTIYFLPGEYILRRVGLRLGASVSLRSTEGSASTFITLSDTPGVVLESAQTIIISGFSIRGVPTTGLPPQKFCPPFPSSLPPSNPSPPLLPMNHFKRQYTEYAQIRAILVHNQMEHFSPDLKLTPTVIPPVNPNCLSGNSIFTICNVIDAQLLDIRLIDPVVSARLVAATFSQVYLSYIDIASEIAVVNTSSPLGSVIAGYQSILGWENSQVTGGPSNTSRAISLATSSELLIANVALSSLCSSTVVPCITIDDDSELVVQNCPEVPSLSFAASARSALTFRSMDVPVVAFNLTYSEMNLFSSYVRLVDSSAGKLSAGSVLSVDDTSGLIVTASATLIMENSTVYSFPNSSNAAITLQGSASLELSAATFAAAKGPVVTLMDQSTASFYDIVGYDVSSSFISSHGDSKVWIGSGKFFFTPGLGRTSAPLFHLSSAGESHLSKVSIYNAQVPRDGALIRVDGGLATFGVALHLEGNSAAFPASLIVATSPIYIQNSSFVGNIGSLLDATACVSHLPIEGSEFLRNSVGPLTADPTTLQAAIAADPTEDNLSQYFSIRAGQFLVVTETKFHWNSYPYLITASDSFSVQLSETTFTHNQGLAVFFNSTGKAMVDRVKCSYNQPYTTYNDSYIFPRSQVGGCFQVERSKVEIKGSRFVSNGGRCGGVLAAMDFAPQTQIEFTNNYIENNLPYGVAVCVHQPAICNQRPQVFFTNNTIVTTYNITQPGSAGVLYPTVVYYYKKPNSPPLPFVTTCDRGVVFEQNQLSPDPSVFLKSGSMPVLMLGQVAKGTYSPKVELFIRPGSSRAIRVSFADAFLHLVRPEMCLPYKICASVSAPDSHLTITPIDVIDSSIDYNITVGLEALPDHQYNLTIGSSAAACNGTAGEFQLPFPDLYVTVDYPDVIITPTNPTAPAVDSASHLGWIIGGIAGGVLAGFIVVGVLVYQRLKAEKGRFATYEDEEPLLQPLDPQNLEEIALRLGKANIPLINPSELELHEIIGHGATGIVKRALWKLGNGREQWVAVKSLNLEFPSEDENPTTGTQDLLDEFINEVEVMMKMTHCANLLPLLACCVKQGNTVQLITPLQEKGTLGHLIENPPIDFRAMVGQFAKQIAWGMLALHTSGKAGILHRDLKPENVFISKNFTAKIGDFTISSISKRKGDSDNFLVGTKGYVAPEILYERAPYSVESDVYAYGVILFEMATEKRVYQQAIAKNNLELQEALELVAEDYPWLPPDYTDITNQCLSRNPADRPNFQTILDRMRNYFND